MKQILLDPAAKLCLNGFRIASRQGKHVYFSPAKAKCILLNATGAFILDLFHQGAFIEDAIAEIMATFSVDRVHALDKVCAFISEMLADGLLLNSATTASQRSAATSRDFQIKTVYLHLTNRCTNQCIYCFNATYRTGCRKSHIPELTTQEVIRLMKEIRELGGREVIFTGGEPLLRPNVIALAENARQLNLTPMLISNGILINPENAPLIARAFDTINISLDSWVEHEHEYQRGNGTFGPAVRGIRLLVDQGFENVIVRVVLTSLTLNSLCGFPQFGKDALSCLRFAVSSYIPNSFTELNELELFPVTGERYFKARLEFSKRLRELGGREFSEEPTLIARIRCGAGLQIISVDPIGNIYPCQALHYPELSFGNIVSF